MRNPFYVIGIFRYPQKTGVSAVAQISAMQWVNWIGNKIFSFILGIKMSVKADNEGYLVVQHSAHFLKTSWKTKYVMVSGRLKIREKLNQKLNI